MQNCERLCKKVSRGVKRDYGSRLRAHVGDVDVGAGVDVVKHVPAGMIGIFVDDKIVAAVPAPVRADGPVPGSDFKGEATGKPESMMVAIEAFDGSETWDQSVRSGRARKDGQRGSACRWDGRGRTNGHC